MQEGVAVEGEGGAKPGVTEVGWPLPCSLSSLLNMNCRARAEGLARRLQTGLSVGSGGSVALENTLLVAPGPDDRYDSMECRHASLTDPDQDLLGDLNLRPIHVVTSEPSLRLCLPSPPTDPRMPEPDSDVYYDFDLTSPESNNEADEKEAEAEVKRDERPESGCLTGLTSPVVSNCDLSDEDGADGQLCPPVELQNTIMSCPDADLRVVRQILSFTTLAEVSVAAQDDEGGLDVALEDESETQQLDERSHDFPPSVSARVGQAQSPSPTTCEPLGTEGADSTTDVQHSRSVQVSSPVANGDSCWRQHELPDSAPHATTLSYSDQERHDVVCSPGSDGDDTLCDDTFEGADNDMHKLDTAVKVGDGGTEGHECDTYRCDAGSPVFVADVTVPYTTVLGERVCSDVVEPEVDACEHQTGREAAAESGCVPSAISGTPPPIPSPHLYPPSEGQPTDMEMRGEVFEDSDTEEIETLAEDDEGSDADENEEDVEEEAILTGKFRNFRGYTERVRRLSEDPEDYTDPETISYEESNLCASPKFKSSKEEDVEEDPSTQLSELEAEVEIVEPEDDRSMEEFYERSSSEEPDPARVEDFKMRIKRSSSLKSGKTPPGTPGRKKIVRFADMMGLDLAAVRTFLGGVPRVPRCAFWDLEVEREAKEAVEAMSMIAQVPTRVLTPLFQQPGAMPDFMARVRQERVVVENVEVGPDLSIRGFIRVLSLDFNKSVHVRYTFDHWRNFHEATATYVMDSHDGATDRFSFILWGNFLQDNGALIFCVRYHTLGQEFWDNNHGRDYVLQCYTVSASAGDGSAAGSVLPQNASSIGAAGYGGGCSSVGYGGGGISASRPDNFSSSSFNTSPTMPNDPWVTRFF